MKICIDTRWLSNKNSGVGCYIENLLKEMHKLKLPYEVCLLGEKMDLANFQEIPLRSIKKKFFQLLWKTIRAPKVEYLTSKIDLFHFTNLTAIPNTAKRNIVTVHDLAFMKFPETIESKNLRFLKKTVPYSLMNASHIIAVSENTKQDIIKYYNISEEKISVVYNGVDEDFQKTPSEALCVKIKHKYNLKKPFFLSVSTLEPRKNFETLLRGYAKLDPTIHQQYDLVIAGGEGWGGEKARLQNLAKTLKIENKVQFLGFVNTKEKKVLFSVAKLYLHTSLYEGFGIGLTEAMTYKIPIIASGTSCHEEIAKDAALYFNVTDSQELAYKIELLLIDKDRTNEFILKGETRVKKFTWKNAAKQTVEIYKKILLEH